MYVRQKSMQVGQKLLGSDTGDMKYINKIWTFVERFTLKRDTLRICLVNCIDGRLDKQRVIWSGYLGWYGYLELRRFETCREDPICDKHLVVYGASH